LVEHLLCKQGVVGSTPSASTSWCRGWRGMDHRGKAGLGWMLYVTRGRVGVYRPVRWYYVLCQCEEVGAHLRVPRPGV